MRRFIVDTDTASDDAAALMIAALSEEIDLLGVTIVAGNVGLKQATDNALMTLEVCGSDAPVYLGAKRPLFRERHETISVHLEEVNFSAGGFTFPIKIPIWRKSI